MIETGQSRFEFIVLTIVLNDEDDKNDVMLRKMLATYWSLYNLASDSNIFVY